LGELWSIIGITLVIGCLLFFKKHYKHLIELFVAIGGGAVTTQLLKDLIQRPRPSLPTIIETSYAMPSGHATMSAAFYGMLIYLLWRTRIRMVHKIIITSLTIIFILAIGFSRLFLGVHYLSDVIAGFALGTFWVLIAMTSRKILKKKKSILGFDLNSEKKIFNNDYLIVVVICLLIVITSYLLTFPNFK